jgi:hypothetical protein
MIIPTAEGCKVISDESQNGPKTKLEKIFAPNMVRKDLHNWLIRLKEESEKQSNNKNKGTISPRSTGQIRP